MTCGRLIFIECFTATVDHPKPVDYDANSMANPDMDALQRAYKKATDRWVEAIRAEEALATADHSETAMEAWDRADFAVQDAHKHAKEARDKYKAGLRALHYGM